MTATFVPCFNGRRFPSFFSRTMDCSEALAAMAWCFSTSKGLPSRGFTAPAVDRITSSSSSTRRSSSSWLIRPDFTASIRSRSESPPVVGISRWEPARTPSTWSLEPPQSDTTKPSKPHSSRRISCKRCLFSLA